MRGHQAVTEQLRKDKQALVNQYDQLREQFNALVEECNELDEAQIASNRRYDSLMKTVSDMVQEKHTLRSGNIKLDEANKSLNNNFTIAKSIVHTVIKGLSYENLSADDKVYRLIGALAGEDNPTLRKMLTKLKSHFRKDHVIAEARFDLLKPPLKRKLEDPVNDTKRPLLLRAGQPESTASLRKRSASIR